MKCGRCQAQNRDTARFCRECGQAFGSTCAGCGAEVDPDGKFCDSCGAPIGGARTAGTPAAQGFSPVRSEAGPSPRFARPELYTPRHLAEQIRGTRQAVEGERKQVTILFADVRGSLELLGDRDPEDARHLLDSVVQLMMAAIHRYEGTVSKVLGDGVMAMFGAPLAHEDHAVRACYAGLAMQELVRENRAKLQRRHKVDVEIRVGMNSGEVVVRSIGQDLGMDYSAIGLTTHLAARMEQTATPGTIQLTAETARLVEGFMEASSLGPQPVKGVATPMEVFQLHRAKPARRLNVSAARGLTRFVGRQRELDIILEALEQAREGYGGVVAVEGEAGVGKSRLFWETIHSPHTEGFRVLEASSVSYGRATTYLPVIDVLKSYFALEERDDAAQIQEKATHKILALDQALAPILPSLLTLLDVPVHDPQWLRLDAPQRRRQTLDALRRLFLRESQVQPVLLVFEDLHWVDSESQAFLDSLRGVLATARMLLLVNYRPEYGLGWETKTAYTSIRIEPLAEGTAETLLESLVGADPTLDHLKRFLIERTGGNPFFLEESVRALAEAQVLAGERGAYRLTGPLPEILIPPTVQSVIAARIDRLKPDEKRLLQCAAAIGKHVPFVLLESLAGSPDEDLRRALVRLQASEFLFEANLYPDLEYSFRHALTHEVAYGSLLQEQRRELHASIVEIIEAAFPGRLAEHMETLAHHATRGEVWDKALGYCRQAGQKAAARCAYREAVIHLERALAALEYAPETREAKTQAIDLRLSLRTSLVPLGAFDKVLGLLQTAEELSEEIADHGRWGRVCVFLSQSLSWAGRHVDAIEAGLRARAIGVALDDFGLQVLGRIRVGQYYLNVGEHRRSVTLLTRTLGSLTGELAGERLGMSGLPSILCQTYLAWSLAELGRFPEALEYAEESARGADVADNAFDRINAAFALGLVRLRRGELDKAIAVLEDALKLIRSAEIPAQFPSIALTLGLAYAQAGRFAEAVPLLDQAALQHGALKLVGSRSLFVSGQAEGYLLAGDLDGASRLCQEALDLSTRCGEEGLRAWALRLQGEITARRDPLLVDEAAAAFREALHIAGSLEMRTLVAHCHLGLGRIARLSGDGPLAEENLEVASTLFAAMDMGRWGARAEEELIALG